MADIFGTPDDEHLSGTAGDDEIRALDGNDVLDAGAGNDLLDGGRGADVMTGGSGNDIYYVDIEQDSVVEAPGGGTDTVRSEISYVLGANVENLTLIERWEFDTQAVNGTGNELANVLVGQGGDNVLTGLGGNDTIDGGDGTDTTVFGGDVTSYTFHKQFNPASNEDQITVSGPDGVDTLTRIELSSFTGPGFYNRFDPVNYLNQNPDIAAGGLDPLTHYLGFGASEGRDPNASVHLASVDGLEYIASYPDLIVAFGDHPATGLQHFEQQGVFEGREPALFDPAQYLANYADLQAAFGTDLHAATEHFVTNGYFEGRTDHS